MNGRGFVYWDGSTGEYRFRRPGQEDVGRPLRALLDWEERDPWDLSPGEEELGRRQINQVRCVLRLSVWAEITVALVEYHIPLRPESRWFNGWGRSGRWVLTRGVRPVHRPWWELVIAADEYLQEQQRLVGQENRAG